MKNSRALAPAFALSIAYPLSGCATTPAPVYETDVTAAEIMEAAVVTTVAPGETAFVHNTTDDAAHDLLVEVPLVDHIYPGGPHDDKASFVRAEPSRVNLQVSLSGDSPKLSNDAACETLPVQGEPAKIGAIALGGDEGGVFISWPRQSDESTGYVYVCSFQDMEPRSSQGAVLFTLQDK